MTPAQQEVVNALDNCCCVVSIPGSGKTTVITEKIAKILRSRPSRRVTAVSFTAEAAKELKERTLKMVPEGDRDRLTTGTFHSLVIRALRGLGHEASKRKIAAEGTCRQYFERAVSLATGEAAVTQEQQRWAETCRMTSQGSYAAGEKGAEQRASIQQYHALMKQANYVDFGELMQIALGMCEADVLLLAQPGDQLLVDEAQDIDRLQLNMILEHQARGVIVDMVGDDDQSIYAFRMGLGIKGMNEFTSFAGAKQLFLDTNFRCRPSILHWAGQVVEQNGNGRIKKHLKAGRPEGGTISYVTADTGEDEEHFVVSELKVLYEQRTCTSAVIARQNHYLQRFEAALKAAQVPTKRLSGSSIWQEGPVCMFVALLIAIQRWKSPAGFEEFLYWMEVRADVIHELSGTFGPRLLEVLDGAVMSADCGEWGGSAAKIRVAAAKALEWRAIVQGPSSDASTNKLIADVAAWCVGYAAAVDDTPGDIKSNRNGKNKERELERLESVSLLPIVAKTLLKFKGSVATRIGMCMEGLVDKRSVSLQFLVSTLGNKNLTHEGV